MKIDIKIKKFSLHVDNDNMYVSLIIFKRDITFSIEKELNGLSALFG